MCEVLFRRCKRGLRRPAASQEKSLSPVEPAASKPSDSNGSSDPRVFVHEANNQISIIIGSAELLATKLGESSEHQPTLRAIVAAARKLANLLPRK